MHWALKENPYMESSDLSGKQKRIKVEITGKNKLIINHALGSRPIRLASLEVMIGMLNKIKRPKLKNTAAPIFF